MDQEIIFDVVRESLWVAVAISTPILGVALLTGIAIGLFQALTSIQEMTLTFVPKMIAMLLTFWVSMTFMTNSLVSFFRDTILRLIAEN
ncbi:flagellar biosynthesis protein FliQ [Mangrovicoccus algicola]|uniref:Flagellar biosynthetic protein FliQ n=1 Tax=Mangrovicoccus algicola TaxID=2771008 RepID=A0A8J6Z916_9RHOB|nr:flagellar biosynthesis protein FliQ [Mangrovicoccus algicola]MBE3640224.1 flagellar biosynthesis protein FliQ [Mangrovicoccus algicola]